jgi:integrase
MFKRLGYLFSRRVGLANRKHSEIENLPLADLDYLARVCGQAKESRDSCLVALAFLSGRRPCELVGVKKKDVTLTKDWCSLETFNAKNYRKRIITGTYEYPRTIYPQIRVNGKRVRSRTPETRYYPRIDVRFSLRAPSFRALGNYVIHHIESLGPEDYLFHTLFSKADHIGLRMAELLVHRLDPTLWLYALRHQRFTQVIDVYKANPRGAHYFFKHASFATTEKYYDLAKYHEKEIEV